MKKRKLRVDILNAAGLLGVAALFDIAGAILNLVGLIPYIGQVVAWPTSIILGITAWVVFTVWFIILKIEFNDPKKIIWAFMGGSVELIPILSTLPGLTTAILVLITTTNFEDATGIKLPTDKLKLK